MRDRGPRVERRRAKISFSGGAVHTEYDAPDGTWCDTWLFEDLVLPMGLVYGAVDQPADVDLISPAVYEDFRPGTYDQVRASRSTWTPTTSRRRSATRTRSRGSRVRASPSAPTRSSRSRASQIYNDWMIDEWCGGDGARSARSRSRSCRCGTPSSRPPRCAAARRRAATRSRSRENPAKLGYPVDPQRQVGSVVGRVHRDRHGGDRCTSARRRRCRPRPTTRRSRCRCRSTRRTRRGRCATGCSRGRSSASPRIKLAYAESQIGWMPFLLERMDGVWHEDVGGVDLAEPPSTYVQRPRLRVHLRRPPRPEEPRRDRARSDPVRVRLPARQRHVAQHPLRRAPPVHRARAWTPPRCTKLMRGNAIECYGLERFGIER